MARKKKSLLIVGLILCLILALSLAGFAAKGGGQGVKVKARVAGQILLSIVDGNEISFNIDPLSNPEDTAQTTLSVMTNAKKYTIIGTFGRFLIGNYDLVKNEKFFVKSVAPGSGKALDDWTLPKGDVTILKNEDGLTMGENTVVQYKLSVDFSVPPGDAQLDISFTAVAAL